MSFVSLSTPVSPSERSNTRVVAWGAFTRIALAAILVASLSNVVVYYLGDALIGYNHDFLELGSVFGVVLFTAVLGFGAVLVYAGLLRFTANPVRNFTIVSAIVFLLTLVPDFVVVPSDPGASNAQIAVLMTMHIVAAVIIVRMLTAFRRD